MSLALIWLGGSEKGVELTPSVNVLLGQWKDLQGSTCMLTQASEAGKIDVLTIRPSDAQRFTEGLVTVRGCNLQWGRSASAKFFGYMDESSSTTWRRGSSKFHWRKLQ